MLLNIGCLKACLEKLFFLVSSLEGHEQCVKQSVSRKATLCSDCLPFWTLRVLQNYDSHVVISQMGPVELINLQAGEMGQRVLHKMFVEFSCRHPRRN